MITRVVVLDDYQQVALTSADWSPVAGTEVRVLTEHLPTPDAVVAALADADVVVAMRERTAFPAAVLDRLPRLRLLVTTGMRNASIDIAAANRLGVTVCGTHGSGAGTGELAWGLLIALCHDLPAQTASVARGGWQVGVGRELRGSTLGILGLGTIGRQVAGYATAFGMRVVAWSQHMTAEQAAAAGAEYVSKADLFERSDAVTVHLTLSARTTGLIGAAELALLGPRGYLVNTSRGPIVDEPALIAALADHTIAGAALDTFDVEPLPPDSPLRTMPGLITTPHVGYVSEQSYAVYFREVVENVSAWLAGRPMRVLAPAS
ncbi:MAG TPA: D-2-hydroxyacid dehydrogenase family protein [Pseudonocardiaceae bacterium]|nr:D-2-hydroxyacid dehydrogenase family protein [Pseudonocardiaceae bacterium]